MRATYAAGGQDDTAVGRIIVTSASVVSAILVIAGLIYWTGATQRHNVAMTVFQCEPDVYISDLPCVTEPMEVSQYSALATAASQQLRADVTAYDAAEMHSLPASKAVLTAEVATEQMFGNGLAAMTFTPQNEARADALITTAADAGNPVPASAVTFTPQMTVTANTLIQADQALATLTAKQARASSLARMRAFNHRIQVASTVVQTEMKLLLKAVNTPPDWS
jgi:hypothetical protein